MRKLLDLSPGGDSPDFEAEGGEFVDPLETEGGDLGNQPINDPSN